LRDQFLAGRVVIFERVHARAIRAHLKGKHLTGLRSGKIEDVAALERRNEAARFRQVDTVRVRLWVNFSFFCIRPVTTRADSCRASGHLRGFSPVSSAGICSPDEPELLARHPYSAADAGGPAGVFCCTVWLIFFLDVQHEAGESTKTYRYTAPARRISAGSAVHFFSTRFFGVLDRNGMMSVSSVSRPHAKVAS
jgi:hypothetical protein